MSANGFLNKITVQYSLEHLLETQGRRIEAGGREGGGGCRISLRLLQLKTYSGSDITRA